jgi:RimJ/RimL family protein N-acetyltransferase
MRGTVESQSELIAPLLHLRLYGPDDVETLFQAVHESWPELSRWLPWCHADYDRDESVAWIESREAAWVNGEEYSFAIADPATGRLLGGCGLNQFDHMRRRANLGYWVRSSETGRGLATMATQLLARFGFEVLRLERIEIVTAIGNQASQRVAEKAGALREGIARRRLRIHGVQHDAVCYSLIPEDFSIVQPVRSH